MNRKAFFVIAGTMFISMLGMGIVTPFLPIYADQLGASPLEIGLVQASFSISNMLSLPFVGRLSDRFGRKVFLCVGLTILALASLGFIWASSPALLILMRLFQGLGASAHLPIAQAYLGDITPEGGEGKWMGNFNTVLFSGIGAGPLVGGVLNDLFNINTTFLVMAGLNLAGLIVTLILLREVTRKTAPREQSSIIAPMRSRTVRGVFAYRMTIGFGTSTFMAFIPLFADLRLGLSASLIGLLLAVRMPVSLTQSYTGRLADRHDRRVLVVVGGIITLIFSALLPASTGFWALLAIYALISFGNALGMPAATAYVVEEGRTYGMGAAMTTFTMAAQVGNAVGPVMLGGVANFLGLESVFYAAAFFMLLGTIIFLWLVRTGRPAYAIGSSV
jgi:DHA1 family multidrug resistance protein-like MFS transporter